MGVNEIADLVGHDEWPIANKNGRPFVVYKFAATLDGRIAAADGTSQWITDAQSRAEVQLLRANCHATIVGSGTQQADNPTLAVRPNDDPRFDPSTVAYNNQPLRVVVDSNARTPADANVLNDKAPTVLAVAADADTQHLGEDVDLLRLPRGPRGLDLHALMKALYERDVKAAFLEGGPTLAGSFLSALLVDRVVCYLAPALLGAGKPGLGEAGINTIEDICRLETVAVDRSGPDIRIVAKPT